MKLMLFSGLVNFIWRIVSQLFVLWIWPVFIIANKRVIDVNDLIEPDTSNDSHNLGNQLESHWRNEANKACTSKKQRKPSLWRAVRRAYWISYMPGGILVLGNAITRFIQPILFAKLLTFWSNSGNMSQSEAGFYALGIVLAGVLGSMCQHHGTMFNGRFGMKIRIACTSLLYRKLLRLNKSSLHSETCSSLVNLMTNDVSRFDYSFAFLHYIWLTPIQAVVVLYLLYRSAGFAPIVGLAAVFLIIIPIQGFLGKRIGTIRRETAEKTDKRIKIISDMLNAIRIIKMSAWESLFKKSVENSRAEEVQCIKNSLYIQGSFGSFMLFTERISLYVTILYIVLTGDTVTAAKIFPIQLYFSLIQANMALYLPLAIANLSEMFVSFHRIEEFLLIDENFCEENKPGDISGTILINDNNNDLNGDDKNTFPLQISSEDNSLVIEDAIATWTKNKQNVINRLSLRVQQGELCAIIGPVGVGKTSLLHLILKEMPLVSGKINVKGRISYASQDPWLFPATIRSNIIFGSTYDKDKYEMVCEACCLKIDFKQFPYGDLSLVGERGVSLSGGQRARINLARAVYREADIYLLDDPLSAVDANVGRQLFDNCINGYLGGRTRVLVTHQIHYLKAEQHVLLMNDGQLKDANLHFYSGQNQRLNSHDNSNELLHNSSVQKKYNKELKKTANDLLEQNINEEERVFGGFKWKVLVGYLSAVNSWLIVTVTIVCVIMANSVALMCDYWISYWANQNIGNEIKSLNKTNIGINVDSAQYQNLGIYSGLILYLIIISCVRISWFAVLIGFISKNLHHVMLKKIIYAKLDFFENKTTGQILNRFSKDIGTMDELLPRAILQVTQLYLGMASVFILNAVSLPWSLIPSAVLAILFFIMLKWYLEAAQEVKRLEGTSKSPVLNMIDSSASGITTIRSFQSEDLLISSFDKLQNIHTSACNSFIGVSAALCMYLDMICLLYLGVLLAAFININFGNMIPVGSVGLAVSQSLVLTVMLQYSARFTADLVGHLVAVERIQEYMNVPIEDNHNKLYKVLPLTWPSKGDITFENISLSYANGRHKALKNVNFKIKAGWKVGVVGRTGSGKSSLAVVLFNLTDFEGTAKIDNVDIKLIHNQNLRARMTIIPQEPVLFSATLRDNLDPFNKFTDEDIWRALEHVELKGIIKNLDMKVSDGDNNFSVGQRQLICLARAILRSNKILVLDEATANVDLETDALIQKTIRREFESCTVLTIAHRLNTIMDSDRVLVIDGGEAVEFDHPYTLLCNPESKFTFMVEKTGDKDVLFDIAKTNYLRRTVLRK